MENVQQSSLSFRIDHLPKREILKSELEEAIHKGKQQGIAHLRKRNRIDYQESQRRLWLLHHSKYHPKRPLCAYDDRCRNRATGTNCSLC